MTQTDCLKLQRKARRSGRLRANACLLLAEICDFHGLGKGCIIENEGLAERLGCTKRSVRNWLRELKSEGLVTEGSEGDHRVLCPRVPAWMQWKDDSTEERSFHADTELSGKDVPERKEDSKEGGKDFPPQKDNNPEGTEESAGARGDDVEQMFDALTDAAREEVHYTRRMETKLMGVAKRIAGDYEPTVAANALREDLDGSAGKWNGHIFTDSVLPGYAESTDDSQSDMVDPGTGPAWEETNMQSAEELGIDHLLPDS